MYAYDELDRTLINERVSEFRDQVKRRLSGELTEDEFKMLRLQNGVYLQLHAYMFRVAIPYGTLSSKQLRALAQNDGVIGLSFVPDFIASPGSEATLERLLDHADHVATVAGIDTVGIGSDFDGGGTLLPDATHLPRLTEGLLRRGYSEADVRQVLGGNTLRVLRATLG